MLYLLGLESLLAGGGDEPDGEAESLLAERQLAREAPRLRSRRRDPRPARRARLGGARHAGRRDAASAWRLSRQIVYGRRPVAEAQRGRRRVRRVWTADDTDQTELEALAGSPDHQGVVAEVDPYPYVDASSLLEPEQALIVALDQVQDPHNLGAVCRSAEAAGGPGVVIPERRSASVTAAACKSSAGAVEHLPIARVRNLADWLARGEACRGLDLRRRRGRRDHPHRRRPHRQGRAGPRQRGEGAARPRWRRAATCSSRSRCAARSTR